MRGIGGLVLLVITLSMLGAAPAWAHASLIDTTPTDATVLGTAPTEVTLRFDEAVGTQLGAVRVLAPDGTRVDTDEVVPSADGLEVTAPLRENLADGTYTVLWRVLSEDTHSIFGASTFSVGEPSATTAAQAQADQAGAGGDAGDALTVTRLLLYAGLALLIGGLGFLVALWPAGFTVVGARRIVWTGWALATAASATGLLLQGPYGAGLPLSSMFDLSLILEVAGTRYGLATLSRLALLGLLALVILRMQRGPVDRRSGVTVAGGILAVAVLGTTSMVGHAGSGPFSATALPVDVIHLAAMAGWLGGLAMLAGAVLRRPDDLTTELRRWSRYAAILVVVLVVTGVFAGWREVREWGALTGTDYGRLLIIKVCSILVLLLAAGVARVLLRRGVLRHSPSASSPPGRILDAGDRAGDGGLASGEPGGSGGSSRAVAEVATVVRTASAVPIGRQAGVRRLRWTVLIETALAVVVLAVTSLLVATPPARETYAPVYSQTASVAGPLQVRMELDPARAGSSTLRLTYTRGGLTPTDAVRVTARFTLTGAPGRPAEVVPVELARVGVGRYQVNRVLLPSAGTWQLAVATQTSDIDSFTTLFSIAVR